MIIHLPSSTELGSKTLDVLSQVLGQMRLESTVYRRFELGAPWCLSFQGGAGGVHIIVRGRCEMVLEGGATWQLESGDLVVVARGDAHVLRSAGDQHAPAVSSLELAMKTEGMHIRAGGGGEETVFVCGAFFFHEADHPALKGLPRIIHVTGELGRTPRWLAAYVDALTSEVFDGGAGSHLVMSRLSDALVARALRFHLENADEPGWLKGLRDPQIAKALSALHDDLKRRWTLSSLARCAGVSRAAFAARFADTVGETPMRYLLRCRMRQAILLLRSDGITLARVADSVGYGSEAALSAAFKRYTGVPPGAYARNGAIGVIKSSALALDPASLQGIGKNSPLAGS